MISRVAESCFWLSRYLERVESAARILRVTRSFVLDMAVSEVERWHPLLVVAGEHRRFAASHPPEAADDGEEVQDFLVWNEENPVSIVSSARWARENARVSREVISLEMWEGINSFWHWLRGGPGRKAFLRDRDEFYHQIVDSTNLFEGLLHNTMLHDEPFDFMRLGMLLERVAQTARILDIKHHATGRSHTTIETSQELAQWSAILQICGGFDLYLKRAGGVIAGTKVVDFLVKEILFPRSIRHGVDRARNFLRRIRSTTELGAKSAERLESLHAWLGEQSPEALIESGLHGALEHIMGGVASICEALHREYFDPPIVRGRRGSSRKRRSPARPSASRSAP